MKKLVSVFICLSIVFSTFTFVSMPQVYAEDEIIENKDTSTTYSYGYTGESEEFINSISNNYVQPYSTEELLSSYDNSQSVYFPDIGDQGAMGSCTSFATTYYQFTFQANKLNNIVTTHDNTYCPNWTYNYINGGDYARGSNYEGNYNILKIFGAATYKDYVDRNINFDMTSENTDNYRYWLINEQAQINALKTRVSSYSYIPISPNSDFTSEYTLNSIKQMISEGNILTVAGECGWGNVQTRISSESVTYNGQPIDDKYDGDLVISANLFDTDNSAGHSVAIVGYDDELCYDVDGNGIIEEYEKGAFKIVNSWGNWWGNNGFCWVLYDAFNDNDNAHISVPYGKIRKSFIRLVKTAENGDVFPFYYINVKNYNCNVVGKFDISTRNRFALYVSVHKLKSSNHYDFGSVNTVNDDDYYSYSGSLFLDFEYDYTYEKTEWSLYISGKAVEGYDNAIEYAHLSLIDNQNNSLLKIADLENIKEYSNVEADFDATKLYMGDLNYDGELTQNDYDTLAAYLNGVSELSSIQKYLSDLNDDEIIDGSDLDLLYYKVIAKAGAFLKGVYEISLDSTDYKVGFEQPYMVPLSVSQEFDHIQSGFIFEPISDEYYCIRSMHEPCMRWKVENIYTDAGVYFKLSKVNDLSEEFSDAEQFKFVKCSDGTYQIISKFNGKYLSISPENNYQNEFILSNANNTLIQNYNINTSPIKMGDVNMDYTITFDDAKLLKSYLFDGELTLTQRYIANVVNDGVLDYNDVNGIYALTGNYYFDYNGLSYLCLTYDTVMVCNYRTSENINNYSGEITIPKVVCDDVSNFKVVGIADGAFKDCTGITKITEKGNVSFVGDDAFKNCTALQIVNLNSVNIVGNNVFENCTSLSWVSLGAVVSEIGDSAFKNCSNLTYIFLGLGPDSIGDSAFENCTSLPYVYIVDTKNIGNNIFKNCSSLKQIIIYNIINIGDNAFEDCISLKEVALSTSAKNIGKNAFLNIENLTIYGKRDSYAEEYALKNNIDFDVVIYDWENTKHSVGDDEKIDGLNSDTTTWRGTFEQSYDEEGLSIISNQSLKITSIMTTTKTLRAALTLPTNWLKDETKMKVWIGNFNGTVTFEFRGADSMSYKKWIGVSKNGWVEFNLSGEFYKNGPDVWEYTTINKDTLASATTLWISFENQEAGSTVYLDEIVLSTD